MTGVELINKATRNLKQRILLTLGRGIIKAIDDSGGIQKLQVSLLSGETTDGIERMQEYGFTSHPRKGAEAFIGFIGGNRDHGIVMAVDDRRYRFKPMAEGEVCIYTDEDTETFGHRILFKRDREIEIKQKTRDIDVQEDKTENIGRDKTIVVDRNLDITVSGTKGVHIVGDVNKTLDANKDTTIAGDDTEDITGSKTKDIGVNETITIGGNKNETITGNENKTVTVNKTETVTGNDIKTVGISSTKTVTATDTLTAAVMTRTTGVLNLTITGASNITGAGITIGSDVTMTGKLIVNGDIEATGTVADFAGVIDNHSH